MAFQEINRRLERLPANAHGAILLMIAAFFFAVMVTMIKVLGQGGMHVAQILLVRQVVMTAIVLPAIMSDFPGVLKTARPGLQVIRVVFALSAMTLGFTAVIHMQLADATAIGFAKGLFVTIFAILILGEKVGMRRWLAVLVGFAGVIIMLRPGSEGFSIYGFYSLVAAASAGLVMVIIRLLSKTDSSKTILTWQALGVGIVMIGPALWFWQWPTVFEWSILIAMGVVSYIAQMFNINAFKFGEASVLASLDYVRLLYATIFGFFLFANLPSTQTWIGAAIIIAASIYTIRREAQNKQTISRYPKGGGFPLEQPIKDEQIKS